MTERTEGRRRGSRWTAIRAVVTVAAAAARAMVAPWEVLPKVPEPGTAYCVHCSLNEYRDERDAHREHLRAHRLAAPASQP